MSIAAVSLLSFVSVLLSSTWVSAACLPQQGVWPKFDLDILGCHLWELLGCKLDAPVRLPASRGIQHVWAVWCPNGELGKSKE